MEGTCMMDAGVHSRSSFVTAVVDWKKMTYFAMYDVHFFAQSFEGKVRMHIIHG